MSAEYGWTDDQILDLTLGRLLRCADIAQARRVEEWGRTVRLVQEQTRAIMHALAGVAHSKRAAKSIQSAASRLRFLPESEQEKLDRLPRTEDVMRLFRHG